MLDRMQPAYCVEVIGRHDDGIDGEWMALEYADSAQNSEASA